MTPLAHVLFAIRKLPHGGGLMQQGPHCLPGIHQRCIERRPPVLARGGLRDIRTMDVWTVFGA